MVFDFRASYHAAYYAGLAALIFEFATIGLSTALPILKNFQRRPVVMQLQPIFGTLSIEADKTGSQIGPIARELMI